MDTGVVRPARARLLGTLDRPAGHVLLIAALAALAYAGALHGPFIFDDLPWIVQNDALRSGSLPVTNRPVLAFTFLLNRWLGGTDPLGFHVVNVAIHLGAGLALYGVVRRALLLPAGGAMDTTRAARVALVVAALWVAHPLQTQAVTYVVQRGESLTGLCFLAGLYALLRGSESARAWPWYAGAVALGWVGVGTKEVMATVPVVFLVFDRVFLARSWRELVRRRWALYAGLFSTWTWLIHTTAPAMTSATSSVGIGRSGPGATEYLLSQPGVLLHYLRLSVWPRPLAIDHYWPVAHAPAVIAAEGAVIVALLGISLIALRRRPALGFLGVAAFLILAPTSSFIPIADLCVEHRMYLPLAPLVVLAVLGGRAALQRLPTGVSSRAAGVAAGVVVALLTGLTALRNTDYASAESIWASALRVNSRNPRAWNELAGIAHRAGLADEALALYRRAVAENDASEHRPLAVPHYNLAVVLHDRGDVREAIHHYRRALRLQPRSTRVMLDLGAALAQTGDSDGAIAQYRRVLRLKPDHAAAHNNLGLALAARGDFGGAEAHLRRALELDPTIPGLRERLRRVCGAAKRKPDGAGSGESSSE